jgi:serine/threonine protein kinase
MGYIDPEFVNTHRRSTESDIYSFGVVLLEIVSGRPPVARWDPSFSLLKWVETLYCQAVGRILDAADARLRGDEAHDRQMERALLVGLWCTHRDPEQRPSIAEAMQALQSEEWKLPAFSLHMYSKLGTSPSAGIVASTGVNSGVSGSSFSSGVRSADTAGTTTGSSESFKI